MLLLVSKYIVPKTALYFNNDILFVEEVNIIVSTINTILNNLFAKYESRNESSEKCI